MDVNGDGKMEKAEYVNKTAERIGMVTNSDEKKDKLNLYLLQIWDTWWQTIMNENNLESVSVDDFLSKKAETKTKVLDKFHLEIENGWHLTFFEVVDANEDNSLDKDEFDNFLKIFRAQSFPEIFYEIDTNNNGAISKGEMLINGLLWVVSNSLKGGHLYGKITDSSP
ncbi:sarcoplasmic calcium-binding protein-like [Lingula anatina]|uniref:Sarcoplasmic calcium-binding protein-like n=1 Tax=Lingula anatina TaxID=7574 RepID=A0A1S3INE5_LINAN|nr:sarcoplasmic calcium-binding protein-like [Lingula anatina]|eukprot:XP_013399059.1 sarcoplasmic calcium-binding protein-like [Lingula anatina]